MNNKFRYSHVLFDLDGTIIDSHKPDMEGLYAALLEYDPNSKESVESLSRFFGIPGSATLDALNIPKEDRETFYKSWIKHIMKHASSARVFPHMLDIIKILHDRGVKLGIVTSRSRKDENGNNNLLAAVVPELLKPYFQVSVSCDDVKRPKPYPDSILHYMEITGAKREEILFIGDAKTDFQCARDSGVDFALALWGYCLKDHLAVQHFLVTPYDILNIVLTVNQKLDPFIAYAREIQAIGQIGLTYAKDCFDIERYERLREISSEMLSLLTNEDILKVKESFLFDKGYITPKIDTRGVVFNDEGKILLVQEKTGLWSLPGGWCDDNLTIVQNTLKEVWEEAGMRVAPKKLIAILNRDTFNIPKYNYGVLKAFMLCSNGTGEFQKNNETLDRKFFALDEIPVDKLRISTTTIEQIKMCFAAYKDENWVAVVE